MHYVWQNTNWTEFRWKSDALVQPLGRARLCQGGPVAEQGGCPGPERLMGWQAALFPTGYSGLHKIRAGQWRGPELMQVVSGPIGKEKVHFEAPPADRVDREIRDFIQWWEKESKNTEGLLRAAIAHFWFVTIHPFEDGNGRIARAITDMIKLISRCKRD
jgi:Fic family protein